MDVHMECFEVATCFVGPRIGRFKEYRAWRAPWNVIFLEKNDDKYYREPEDGSSWCFGLGVATPKQAF